MKHLNMHIWLLHPVHCLPLCEVEITLLQIMDALLSGCRDEDENIRLACADCIGTIGALDPGLLLWRELQCGMFDRSVLYCE